MVIALFLFTYKFSLPNLSNSHFSLLSPARLKTPEGDRGWRWVRTGEAELARVLAAAAEVEVVQATVVERRRRRGGTGSRGKGGQRRARMVV